MGPQMELLYFTWAQGFMTAVNFAKIQHNSSFKELNGWSTEEQERHIREYCDQHPLGDFMDAILDLLQFLPDRAVKQ